MLPCVAHGLSRFSRKAAQGGEDNFASETVSRTNQVLRLVNWRLLNMHNLSDAFS